MCQIKVVASLTTLPDRTEKFISTIKSLLTQTRVPDVIYVTIPKIAKRLNQGYDKKVIEYVKSMSPIIQFVELEVDYGPLCKILGAIKEEQDPETIIITFDDDISYHSDIVQKLIDASFAYPNSAISSSGAIFGSRSLLNISSIGANSPDSNWIIGFKVDGSKTVDLLPGFAGVLYKRSHFDTVEDIVQYATRELYYNDDVLISGYISKRGIERRVVDNIPFCQRSETTSKLTGNELSYSKVKFLTRFTKAVHQAFDQGMYPVLEYSQPYESVGGKIFLFLLVVLIVLFGVYISRKTA